MKAVIRFTIISLPAGAGVARVNGGLDEGNIGQGCPLYHQSYGGHVHEAGRAYLHPQRNMGAVGSDIVEALAPRCFGTSHRLTKVVTFFQVVLLNSLGLSLQLDR